jgi:hypothetical protein
MQAAEAAAVMSKAQPPGALTGESEGQISLLKVPHCSSGKLAMTCDLGQLSTRWVPSSTTPQVDVALLKMPATACQSRIRRCQRCCLLIARISFGKNDFSTVKHLAGAAVWIHISTSWKRH